jgi:nitrogenase molybdenum-cofactor synthesis protein NifE
MNGNMHRATKPALYEDFRKSQVMAYSALPGHRDTYLQGKIAGALLLVSRIEDAVPLIHGPVGCSFQRKICAYRPYSLFYELPCTNLDDTNTVFGGEEALRDAIVETYAKYRPNLIVVITTCPSDLVGDDVGAVVREVNRHTEVECEVIYSTGDFVGKAKRVGSQDVFYAIVDQLLTPDRNVERIEGSVNLVLYSDNRAGMTTEMVSVLEKMGIKINRIYFDHTRVEDLYELPRAELNIFLRSSPMVWAELMERRWGMESFVVSPTHKHKDLEMINPYGIEGSARIFMEIAKKLGKEGEGEEVVRKLKGDTEQKLSKLKKGIQGRRIAIVGGLGFRGIDLVAVKDLGMRVSALVYRTQHLEHHQFSGEAIKEQIELNVEVANKYGSEPLVLVNPSAEEEIKAIKGAGTELVICGAADAFRYNVEGLKTFNSRDFGFHYMSVGFGCSLNLCIQIKVALENSTKKSPLLRLLEYDPLSPQLTPCWARLQDLFGITREGSKGGEMRYEYL